MWVRIRPWSKSFAMGAEACPRRGSCPFRIGHRIPCGFVNRVIGDCVAGLSLFGLTSGRKHLGVALVASVAVLLLPALVDGLATRLYHGRNGNEVPTGVLFRRKGDALQTWAEGGCIALDKTGKLTADAGGDDLERLQRWTVRCLRCRPLAAKSEPRSPSDHPPCRAEGGCRLAQVTSFTPRRATAFRAESKAIACWSGPDRFMTPSKGSLLRQQRGGRRMGCRRQDAAVRPLVDGELARR